ncbi:MAG: hypothetical protein K9N51_01935 [Candidatus Pacebacteria bacterium]|nr:hypothetical protein [Candidatus Paceibacterota bacterium]
MNKVGKKGKEGGHGTNGSFWRQWLFPCAVLLVYAVLVMFTPQQAIAALKASWGVFVQIAPALVMAFLVMIALNLWITPAHVKRFLGKGTGLKGVFFSSAAGIVSMGPIYAWYPLLKEFREKGVSGFHLANFLGCRAVKIPLLPMMAAYFGWAFTGLVSLFMVLSAIVTGLIVDKLGE